MTSLEAIWLGIVQGLTEFLPVSSSGHLVIVQALLGVTHKGVVFEVAVHVATLLSVLAFYRARVAALAFGALSGRRDALEYVAKLALATVPAVALVLIAGDFLEGLFDRPVVAGWGLLATGAILWSTRLTLPNATIEQPSWSAAWWIGCAQAIAIVPGVSRSGSTVAASLALGVAPPAAAEFSFLMSVPAILGAAVLKAGDLSRIAPGERLPIALAIVAAGISGFAAIWLFVRLLRTRGFHRFAYYTWAVGALFLIWLGAR